MTAKQTTFKRGDRVTFKCAGKVARLEGVAGKWVTATVTDPTPHDGLISVMADYRKAAGATFRGMGTAVPVENVRRIN